MINAKSSGEGMEQTMEGWVFDKYEFVRLIDQDCEDSHFFVREFQTNNKTPMR